MGLRNARMLKQCEIYVDVLQADRLINLGVVKQHSLSKASLGMKNLMGLAGSERNRFHQDIGATLADLAGFLKPQLVVLDAIRSLVHNGPTGGALADVRRKDVIAAGVDQVAVDAFGADAAGPRSFRYRMRRGSERARSGDDELRVSRSSEGGGLMASRKRTYWVVWLRRAVQTAFLALFLILFLATVERPVNQAGGGVEFFFQIDPLAGLSSWLASHSLDADMLLSLVTIGVTLVFGRWFCGWLCPLGTVHNCVASLRGASVKERLDTAGYSRWHTAKYYALAALLGAALFGANLAGWLDPFSFFLRSLGTSVYPAIDNSITGVFAWIYNVDPNIGPLHLTAITEPVYSVLRATILSSHPLRYSGGVLIGLLFLAALALNFLPRAFLVPIHLPAGRVSGRVRAESRGAPAPHGRM